MGQARVVLMCPPQPNVTVTLSLRNKGPMGHIGQVYDVL